MKVLVVDDEGIVLDSCRRILAAEGFDVIVAPSVDEALKRLDAETDPLPLLLMDVKMPVRDGMDLMRQIREKGLALKIIVMSGYPTEETIEKAGMLGATTFIAKPFTPEELLETVRSVAGKEKEHE